MSWLLVYSALAAGPLLLVTIVVIVNALWAPVLARYWPPPGAARPRVSALVPARNEADGIAGCVRALLAQDYPALEILVWDDGSTDATGAIVAGLAAGDRRLRLLTGPPPPPGWFGKHHACWQAAGRATGDWLLFVDADTRLAPAAVSRLVAAGGATGADLVTALPRQRVVTPGERLVVPLVYASIICLLPLPLVPRRPEPSLATGIGQVMFFRAGAYRRLGGHAAVRDRVLDDVELARAIKRDGGRLLVADGGGLVECRMYRSWREVWQGFGKNLYAFFGHRPVAFALGLLVTLALWVGPCLTAPLALLAGAPAPVAAAATLPLALILIQRLVIALRFGYPVLDIALHPVAMLALIAVALNSVYRYYRGGGEWKGRPARTAPSRHPEMSDPTPRP